MLLVGMVGNSFNWWKFVLCVVIILEGVIMFGSSGRLLCLVVLISVGVRFGEMLKIVLVLCEVVNFLGEVSVFMFMMVFGIDLVMV